MCDAFKCSSFQEGISANMTEIRAASNESIVSYDMSSADLSADSEKELDVYHASDYCARCNNLIPLTKDTPSETVERIISKKEESARECLKSASFPLAQGIYFKDKEKREELTLKKCAEIAEKKKKKVKKRITAICTSNCRFDIVRTIAEKFGMKDVQLLDDWDIYWTDYTISPDKTKDLKRYQRVNHFPGMNEICRKDLLARNLNRMAKLFPHDYKIYPKTWCLPTDVNDVISYAKTHPGKMYILKPETGCRGNGIVLTRNIKKIKSCERMICQLYLEKPFLIDGLKFDLRVYTLITSCDPLRVYVYNEGLARFATSEYKEPSDSNSKNLYMHLTNYSLNKHSRYYVADESGTKRRLSTLNLDLRKLSFDVDQIWRKIDDVIVKTIIVAHPSLKEAYTTCFINHEYIQACFELLGFDIILDSDMNPYVLEVNHSPSYHTDRPIDREIKEALLTDTFKLVNLPKSHKRRIAIEERKIINGELGNCEQSDSKRPSIYKEENKVQAEWEEANLGNFRKVYPCEGDSKYQNYFNQSEGLLFSYTNPPKMKNNSKKTHQDDSKEKEIEIQERQESNGRIGENLKKMIESKEHECLERLEKRDVEINQMEKEIIEIHKRERNCLEKECKEKEERERLEKEHKEREEHVLLEKEYLGKVRKEKEQRERLDKEYLEKERLRLERMERARLQKECLERECLEREYLEKESYRKEHLETESSQNNSPIIELPRKDIVRESFPITSTFRKPKFPGKLIANNSMSEFQIVENLKTLVPRMQENESSTIKQEKRRGPKEKENQTVGSTVSIKASIIKPNLSRQIPIKTSKLTDNPTKNGNQVKLNHNETASPQFSKDELEKMFVTLKSKICDEMEKEIHYGRSENRTNQYSDSVSDASQSMSNVIQVLSQVSIPHNTREKANNIGNVNTTNLQQTDYDKGSAKSMGNGKKRRS